MAFVAPKIIGGREAITPVEGEGFKKISEAIRLIDMNLDVLMTTF